MRNRPRSLILGLLLATTACFVVAASPARAESRDASTVALGWQTENADEIVVGTYVGETVDPATRDRDADFRVDRVLKGASVVGATMHVAYASHGLGAPWLVGVPHLLFLRRSDPSMSASSTFVPISGAFSVRPLAAGSVESRFPDLVAALELVLESKDPAALRTTLVAWMDDKDPGIAWSGATDFVRHAELHATLSDAERTQIVGAFARQPIGKNTKGALALAAAATRSDAAVHALVESLDQDGAKQIRGIVAEALRRMDAPSAEGLLAAHLKTAAPDRQAALLGALAVVGGAAAAPFVQPLLESTDGSVRIEAAAALGGMARNARAKDPAAQLGMASALATHVLDQGTPGVPAMDANEIRARLWSLAQLDEPAAFDTLRKAAATSTRPEVKDYAARLLARPRQSLVLR